MDLAEILVRFEEERGTGCWRWLGEMTHEGYGRVRRPGEKKYTPAHRIFYEIHVGLIPAGLCIDHLCRNRACVNPAHLEAVTIGENVRRGLSGKLSNGAGKYKTHCKRGHPRSGDNLYQIPDERYVGGLATHCRACREERRRRFRRAA